MKLKLKTTIIKTVLVAVALFAFNSISMAQDKKITRIAKITIDSTQLSSYMKLLNLQMETAIKMEPGVLSYTVYADKSDACKITIIETYADNDAYMAHREAKHFIQYKEVTKDMVKSLDLSEVKPVLALKKNK